MFERHVAADDAVLTGLPDGSDLYAVTSDGERVPVEINAATYEYRGRSLILGVFRDVSGRRARQRELEQRNAELELLNRVVRHDIRNDMTVVLGWLDVLGESADEEERAVFGRIRRAANHVVEITTLARDYARVVSRETDEEREPVRLGPVLESELDAVREMYGNVEFETGATPDVSVWASEMLGTVFRNLLHNAVVHSDETHPHVAVSVDVDDDRVTVRVADDGPGVPDHLKDAVFERGEQRLDSPGSGIGLHLVETLVESYEGSVRVADNEPTGAVFVVELERADDAVTA